MIDTKYKKTIVSNEGEISYLTPKGHWPSIFLGVSTELNKENKTMLRMHFAHEVPNSNGVRFRSGRNFQPNLVEGSGLHWFTKVWLGEEKLKWFISTGADWNSLIGERGIGEIRHIQGTQAKPFVNLESMRPVGGAQDGVIVNVPRFTQAVTPTASTRTVTQAIPAAVPVERTITASASTCPYCGAEVNRFGASR